MWDNFNLQWRRNMHRWSVLLPSQSFWRDLRDWFFISFQIYFDLLCEGSGGRREAEVEKEKKIIKEHKCE